MPVGCARVARTCTFSRFNIGENDDKMVVKRHLIVLWSEASRVRVDSTSVMFVLFCLAPRLCSAPRMRSRRRLRLSVVCSGTELPSASSHWRSRRSSSELFDTHQVSSSNHYYCHRPLHSRSPHFIFPLGYIFIIFGVRS